MTDSAQNLILGETVWEVSNKSNINSEQEIFDSFRPIIASFRSFPFDWVFEL
jgi:hypothetical protein